MRLACRALIFHLIAVSAVPILCDAADNATTQALHQLFDWEWEYQMAHDPVTASQLGDRRWNDKWQDLSLSAVQESYHHAREVQGQRKAIDRTHLSAEEQVNYAVFNYNISDCLQGAQYKWHGSYHHLRMYPERCGHGQFPALRNREGLQRLAGPHA